MDRANDYNKQVSLTRCFLLKYQIFPLSHNTQYALVLSFRLLSSYSKLSKLQRLQIRARELIENAKYKDGWNCTWLDVKSLIPFDQGVMTYKILHGLCPDNLRHKFVERSMVSEFKTRNHRDLQIPKVRLEYAKRSFYFSGVKNWNDMPGNIREQESLARFKKRFRKYLQNLEDKNGPLVEQQFYSIYHSFS